MKPQAPAPSRSRLGAGMALALLMAAAFLSFLDRQILTLLVAPIETDLRIGDVQIGLLQGFSFAVLFGVMAMPIGWLVDRLHRWRVLAAGVAVWSLAAIGSGLAANYHQLLAARTLVGIGEASLMPAAYSLLADYYPAERRGRAFGVFALAVYLGGGGSLLLGGMLLHALGAASRVSAPLFGSAPVWRLAFLILGAPGLAVAAVLALLPDPQRGETRAAETGGAVAFGGYVRRHGRVFALVWTAYVLFVFATYAFLPWAPVELGRRFALPPATLGVLAGLLQIAGGAAGSLAAGWLGDRWTRAGRLGGKFRLPLLMCAGCLPSLAVFVFAGGLPLAAAGFFAFSLFNTFSYVSAGAAIQDMVPSPLRGQTTALWYMVTGVLGVGGGPYVTALVSARIGGHGAHLGLAILLVCAPAALLGVGVTLAGLRPYDDLRRRVRDGLAEAP